MLAENDEVRLTLLVEDRPYQAAGFMDGLAGDAALLTAFSGGRQDHFGLLLLNLLKLRQHARVGLCADRARQICQPRTLQDTNVRDIQRPQGGRELSGEPDTVITRHLGGW